MISAVVVVVHISMWYAVCMGLRSGLGLTRMNGQGSRVQYYSAASATMKDGLQDSAEPMTGNRLVQNRNRFITLFANEHVRCAREYVRATYRAARRQARQPPKHSATRVIFAPGLLLLTNAVPLPSEP